MRAQSIRLAGLACTVLYGSLIVWLYGSQPRTLSQITGGLASTVGVYQVDPTSFEEGLQYFRRDRFREARAALARADPARRDPRTQFYLAYTYYREGWGRLYRDDGLYRLGLEAVRRAASLASDGRVLIEDDPDLGLHSSDELEAELQAGLTREISDFNPLRVLRSRK